MENKISGLQFIFGNAPLIKESIIVPVQEDKEMKVDMLSPLPAISRGNKKPVGNTTAGYPVLITRRTTKAW